MTIIGANGIWYNPPIYLVNSTKIKRKIPNLFNDIIIDFI